MVGGKCLSICTLTNTFFNDSTTVLSWANERGKDTPKEQHTEVTTPLRSNTQK